MNPIQHNKAITVNAKEIEFAIAKYYNPRQCNIVPNVSWGVGLHECDLLVIKPSKWAIEIEIKISKADLKADLKKHHQHKHEMISQLYYAMPVSVYEQSIDIIPTHAGIYVVDDNFHVKCIRESEKNKDSRKLTDEEITKILRLGNLRTWSMREKILQQEGRIEKRKTVTKRERYDGDLFTAVNNLRCFLSRRRFEDENCLNEQIEYLDNITEKYQSKQ